jgi:nucleotide-binding universal stress UspA family protein
MMKKRILLGVDADLSPTTQQALRAVGDVFAQCSPYLSLTVLTVIPLVQTITTTPGMFVGQALPLAVTEEQRSQAEGLLRKACRFLEQQGIEPECMQQMMRVGVPAEEIVKVARELQVHVIVVGSRGNTLRQHLRRWLLGSTSRRVLETAPCPVMIASLAHAPRPTNLVAWYEQAVMHYLQEHPEALTVFTPQQVAQQFIPPALQKPGHKEIVAATLALEQLVNSRMLYRRQSQGELQYVND